MNTEIKLNIGVEPTKENVKALSTAILADIQEGYADPLEVATRLTALEQACAMAKSGMKETLTQEIAKYGKSATCLGARISITTGYAKYDYSADPEYARLEAELKARKELLSMASKAGKSIINGDEVIEPLPVQSYTADSVKIELAK